MARCSASAARFEQCIFWAGSPPSASATARLEISAASSSVLPMTISVTMLEVATAAPQPNVLNLTSVMRSSSTLIVMRMTSPQTGLPIWPAPSGSSTSPTLRGLEKWSITRSVYISLPLHVERTHLAQPRDDGRKHLEKVVDVGVGVLVAERKTNAAVRLFGGVAHAEDDVRRLQRARRAGRAAGHRDTLAVELEDHRLTLDEAHRDTDVARQTLSGMTEVDRIFDRREKPLGQTIAQRFEPGTLAGHLGDGQLERRAEADDAGHVLGTRAQSPFVAATVQDGRHARATPYVQGADTLRPVELVARQREHVDAQI